MTEPTYQEAIERRAEREIRDAEREKSDLIAEMNGMMRRMVALDTAISVRRAWLRGEDVTEDAPMPVADSPVPMPEAIEAAAEVIAHPSLWGLSEEWRDKYREVARRALIAAAKGALR